MPMTAEQQPIVRIERANGIITISFAVSVIDKCNFSDIADQLEEILRCPNPQLVAIDLSGVTHIDELGLAVIQSLQESVKDVGGTATLRGPTVPIERAVNETRLAKDLADPHTIRKPPQWTRW